jgi:hypothetical protein
MIVEAPSAEGRASMFGTTVAIEQMPMNDERVSIAARLPASYRGEAYELLLNGLQLRIPPLDANFCAPS